MQIHLASQILKSTTRKGNVDNIKVENDDNNEERDQHDAITVVNPEASSSSSKKKWVVPLGLNMNITNVEKGPAGKKRRKKKGKSSFITGRLKGFLFKKEDGEGFLLFLERKRSN